MVLAGHALRRRLPAPGPAGPGIRQTSQPRHAMRALTTRLRAWRRPPPAHVLRARGHEGVARALLAAPSADECPFYPPPHVHSTVHGCTARPMLPGPPRPPQRAPRKYKHPSPLKSTGRAAAPPRGRPMMRAQSFCSRCYLFTPPCPQAFRRRPCLRSGARCFAAPPPRGGGRPSCMRWARPAQARPACCGPLSARPAHPPARTAAGGRPRCAARRPAAPARARAARPTQPLLPTVPSGDRHGPCFAPHLPHARPARRMLTHPIACRMPLAPGGCSTMTPR
jgi:hypothetical protein